jgi:hypothetical protein
MDDPLEPPLDPDLIAIGAPATDVHGGPIDSLHASVCRAHRALIPICS